MKKVFIFGGGTGLSNLLKSLKDLDCEITIGVTTSDNGGSTGKIRNYYGVPALGDLRKVLTSFIDDKMLQDLVEYRFDEKLENHTVGNIMLAALVNMSDNLSSAVAKYSSVFNIPFIVYPITEQSVHLNAKMEYEDIIKGETQIVKHPQKIKKVFYDEEVEPCAQVVEALKAADYIIFSSGSLYTSLMSNLVIKEIQNTLQQSKAKKIYVCNIMTQKGEIEDYKASDHIKAIEKHTYKGIVDMIIANNYQNISSELKEKYLKENASLVMLDKENINGVRVIEDKLIQEGDYIRHDIKKVKDILQNIIEVEDE